MIPILQFDPATLTLWYDTQLLATSRASREVGLALHYAIDGRDDWLECLVRQQRDEWTHTRCATVASAVWHEKRHFLDFILTNYGAMRVRQFFQCYFNTRVFLQKVAENGPVLLPLDRNLSPYRCKMMGVSLHDPDLVRVAEWISRSKSALLDDRRPLVLRGTSFEVGGEAMLEAIAFHCQVGKTHRVFGAELADKVQRDSHSNDTVADKYQWAYKVLIRSGILKFDSVGEHDRAQRMVVHDGPMVPILYAALAGRYHNQTQTVSAFASSGHPTERLTSLIAHFDEHKIAFADLTSEAAWESVNVACKQLFGRTVLEEIDADYEKEHDFINLFRNAGTDEFVTSAYEDFHHFRGRLIQVLKDDPQAILDQAGWADRFVNKSHPFVVAAAPAGVIGHPPKGFKRLSGYADADTDFEKAPDFQWWWTAMRVLPISSKEEETYQLSNQDVWSNIIADYAPMSKLMIDGNRMRSMVGPELSSTKTRIERQTGVSLIMDPLSRYPDEKNFDIAQWYFLTGQDRFRCQVTHQIVHAPHGRLIGPWEFRRKPAFVKSLIQSLTGSQQQRMLRAIWRDWSPWLVCDQVAALFDAAKTSYADIV